MATRRFEFRLQKVLQFREAVEQRLQQALAQLEVERIRRQHERERLLGRLVQAEERLRDLQRGKLDLVEDELQRNFIRELNRLATLNQEEIRTLDARIRARRAELVQAARDRKVMERLRERAYAEYVAEHLRQEQTVLDEMGVVRYVGERQSAAAASRDAPA